MQGSDQALTQEEKDAQWVRRGKKYKTKYFTALKDLFKEVENNTNYGFEQENCCPSRRDRSDLG